MKTSIFLTSFFSMYCRGSKPRTSPAMRVANCDASNFVMLSMPLVPAASAAQFSSVPMPSDDTRPMPVTTTRRLLPILWFTPRPIPRLLLALGVRFDVLDGFLDASDLLRVFVGDLEAELLLERHDELDGVERIGAQIVDERGVRRYFLLVDPELFHDDALHFVGYGHSNPPRCDAHRQGRGSPPKRWAKAEACALHVHAAVDGEHVPRNIRCLVRCKIACGRGNIVNRSKPAQRNLGRPVHLRAFVHGAGHVRIDHPRCNHVDRDAARSHFPGQRLGKPDETGFRRGIVGLARVAHLPYDRTHRDDPSAVLLQHRAHRGLREHERGGEVRRDDSVPVGALHAHQQLIARDAGVADHDVEPSVPRHDGAGHRFDGCRVGDVEPERFGAPPRRAQFVGDALRVVGPGGGHDHRTLLGEPCRNRAADAARRTCHERHFAGEIKHWAEAAGGARTAGGRRAPDVVPNPPDPPYPPDLPFVSSGSIFARSSGLPNVAVTASRCTLRARPVSTLPGPTSTYVVTPSDARRVITASQRTGDET